MSNQDEPIRDAIAEQLSQICRNIDLIIRLWVDESQGEEVLERIRGVRAELDQVKRDILEHYLRDRVRSAVAGARADEVCRDLRAFLDRVL